jgi:diguanylate cyclase (GGDEF)-like protein
MRLTGARLPPGFRFVEHPPLSPAWAAVAISAALLLVFVMDWATGSAPVQHLYYLPIIFAGIRFGARGGLASALASILFYHLANPRALTFHYEESDVLQIAVFVAVGLVSARLAADRRALHRLAMTDDLTGLHNLRSFEERLRSAVRAARETKTPLSLLVLDLDRLKSLNDVHGHLAGAEAVRTVGRILARRLPAGSEACRYGGDEFVVAIPRSGEAEAVAAAEDLCRAVSAVAPVLAGVSFPAATLSISVGVACWTDARPEAIADRADLETVGEPLFRAADAALYAAKKGGRNRVSVAPAILARE